MKTKPRLKNMKYLIRKTYMKNGWWTKCKLLGSILDTKEDIQLRANVTISHMKDKKHIYKSKNLSIIQKIRYFKMFAGSIFLYHSELWTLTKTLSDSIDAFHLGQLRYTIGIVYPRVISNAKLYKLTKAEPWSKTIERRRCSWICHLMRLDPEVPARKGWPSTETIKEKTWAAPL